MSVGPDGESDLELLLIEIGVLWGLDARGRYEEPPRAAIAVCEYGMAVVSAPDVPDRLSDRLHAIVEDSQGMGQARRTAAGGRPVSHGSRERVPTSRGGRWTELLR